MVQSTKVDGQLTVRTELAVISTKNRGTYTTARIRTVKGQDEVDSIVIQKVRSTTASGLTTVNKARVTS
jgi:hypothetical protein